MVKKIVKISNKSPSNLTNFGTTAQNCSGDRGGLSEIFFTLIVDVVQLFFGHYNCTTRKKKHNFYFSWKKELSVEFSSNH